LSEGLELEVWVLATFSDLLRVDEDGDDDFVGVRVTVKEGRWILRNTRGWFRNLVGGGAVEMGREKLLKRP
jgi:hypothetical protein